MPEYYRSLISLVFFWMIRFCNLLNLRMKMGFIEGSVRVFYHAGKASRCEDVTVAGFELI